jgi:nitroreductase
MLTAQSMGYDSRPMDGFDFAEIGKIIHLPSDHILTMRSLLVKRR